MLSIMVQTRTKLGSFWQKRTAPDLGQPPFDLIKLGSFWQKSSCCPISHSGLLT